VENSDALLVVGTSLEVFSAYRFVRAANKAGKPIAIVNFGETRAERDGLAGIRYKSDANCAELLRAVAENF
jgi:NAD-dependent SIR2 family protein deacetylase